MTCEWWTAELLDRFQYAKKRPQGSRMFRSMALKEKKYDFGLRKIVYSQKNSFGGGGGDGGGGGNCSGTQI
jgi:hypothetical protein